MQSNHSPYPGAGNDSATTAARMTARYGAEMAHLVAVAKRHDNEEAQRADKAAFWGDVVALIIKFQQER